MVDPRIGESLGLLLFWLGKGCGEMLIHVIVDYGPGDLAFAEVAQRIKLCLPDAEPLYTPVPALALSHPRRRVLRRAAGPQPRASEHSHLTQRRAAHGRGGGARQ